MFPEFDRFGTAVIFTANDNLLSPPTPRLQVYTSTRRHIYLQHNTCSIYLTYI